MLVDADILIWYLCGYHKGAHFLSRLAALKLSVVAYMELVQGMRDNAELSRLGKDLKQRKVTILPITEAISWRPSAYWKRISCPMVCGLPMP